MTHTRLTNGGKIQSTLVVGAGIIGVCQAYALALRGHHVTVVESLPELCSLASGINSGLLEGHNDYPSRTFISQALSCELPWSPTHAPDHMQWFHFDLQAVLTKSPTSFARWAWHFVRRMHKPESLVTQYAALRNHSKATLLSWMELRDPVTGRQLKDLAVLQTGEISLFRSEATLQSAAASQKRSKTRANTAGDVLDHAQLAHRLPWLLHSEEYAGAISLPESHFASSTEFARGLSGVCRELGVNFHFGTRVKQVRLVEGGFQVDCDDRAGAQTTLAADNVVLCTGYQSLDIVDGSSLHRLPIYPLLGYSATATLTEEDKKQGIAGTLVDVYTRDTDRKVVLSRFGNTIRVTSVVELAGNGVTHGLEEQSKPHDRIAKQLLHAASNITGLPQHRFSLRLAGRPTTADWFPVIGMVPLNGRPSRLFVNVGHGGGGWAMAAGSADVLAHLICKLDPAVEIEALSPQRFLSSDGEPTSWQS